MTQDRNTEDIIFEAAREVFHEQGYEGARMQEIARRAGINQSMLHYYFRTKDKLFEAVFQRAALAVVPPVIAILKSDLPLLEKIERLVHGYIDLIVANPHVPAFILQELRRNPEGLRQMVGLHTQGVFDKVSGQVHAAVAAGEIRPIEPEQLFANVMSLVVFPFIARPMLQTVFGCDDAAYAALLDARKHGVTGFILNALVP